MMSEKAKKLSKRTSSPLASHIRQRALPAFPYSVLPDHHTAVTKSEQHIRFTKYDRQVVHYIPDKLHAFEKRCQVTFIQYV